jgi:hypothetical protein
VDQPAAKKARAARPTKNLNEDLAAAAASATRTESAEVTAQIALRSRWEEIDTALLCAWILEFDKEARRKPTVNINTPRETLLLQLVDKSDKYRPPADDSDWAKQLLDCGRRMQMMPRASNSMQHSELALLQARRAKEVQEAAAAAIKSRAAEAAFEAEVARLEEEEHHQASAAAMPARSSPPAASPPLPAVSVRYCLTCLTPAHVPTGPWICTNVVCRLRGDLTTADPTNAYWIDQHRTTTASAAASSSASAGQKDTDIAAASAAVSRLDKELERLAKEEPAVYPLFDERCPGTAVEHEAMVTAAFARVRKTLFASRNRPPSKALISLIQKGKLKHVGFAQPKPISAAASAMNEENDTVALLFQRNGGVASMTKESLEPPAISSLSAWTTTLHSVILPALAAQPRAAAEWIALSLTMEAIERDMNWTAAMEYCTLLLYERVPQALGFSDISQDVYRDLRGGRLGAKHAATPRALTSAASEGGAPRAARMQSRVAQPAMQQRPQVCGDYNSSPDSCAIKCAARGRPCSFLHNCRICSSANHGAHACPTRSGVTAAGAGSASVVSHHSKAATAPPGGK